MSCSAPFDSDLMKDFKADPIAYWMLYSSSPDTAALAKLAIRILSIRVTGAMIERTFSASGLIQTAPRNRTSLTNKVVKMVRVKGHISVRSRKSELHMEILANAVIDEEKKDAEIEEEKNNEEITSIDCDASAADEVVESVSDEVIEEAASADVEEEVTEEEDNEEFINFIEFYQYIDDDELVLEEGVVFGETKTLYALDLNVVDVDERPDFGPLSLSEIVSSDSKELDELFKQGLTFS
jgi:hypothetical protein